MRPPAGEDLYEVVDGRYQRVSTILTSNRAVSEWLDLFDQSVLGSATIDRLAHGATQLTITGDSYRLKGPRDRGTLSTSPPRRGGSRPSEAKA